MKLIKIPEEKYEEYRLDLIFDCYKWDPQFLDNNTVAKNVLVISQEEHEAIKRLTEQIDEETRNAEKFLNNNLKYSKKLNLPKKIFKELKNMKNYDENLHVRLMRYDFHQTKDGWAVSEVNSDVPGGFAEASLIQKYAKNTLNEKISENLWYINFGEILVDAISAKVKKGGTIMLVHCTCFSDDRQVMEFLGDRLKEKNYKIIYAAADHLRFKGNKAYSILEGNECEVDGIFRFTPLEWLKDIKPKRWQGYFSCTTPACNHPVAIFAQTKRFPLVWDILEKNNISMKNWRNALPETKEVKEVKDDETYIYKPSCGRVGEKISIKEACIGDEYKKILKDVKKHPKQYIMQKKFISKPVCDENGIPYHVCLGSYTVNGKHAGYYARVSKTPRIDSNAADIPVLIERSDV